MTDTARRKKTFKTLAALVVLYALVLFIAGCHNLWSDTHAEHRVEGHMFVLDSLLLIFLPLVLLGLLKPSTAFKLLLCGAAGMLITEASVGSRTADGTGAAVAGGIVIVGIPMICAALLYRWRSSWSPQ